MPSRTMRIAPLFYDAPGQATPRGNPGPSVRHLKSMSQLPDSALDVLFRNARTHRAWLPDPVPDELIYNMYDLFKLGPTSANSSPARVVFVKSAEAKARLLPCMAAGNVEKTRTAPLTAIVAYDLEFYEKMPELNPYMDGKAIFAGKPDLIQETAFRNGSLQGAYLMMAARALGLDCNPMSGFEADKVNAEFFPDGKWKVNFICNLGHGDPSKLQPRLPRLPFDEACKVLW
jgi:3-hydroxypropanoate dehydrogenase